jgi:site-specific DNA recombinase
MRRAAIYCRVSDDRSGQGLGVERQLEDCLEIARRKGWPIGPESMYVDNDASASAFSKKARKEYLRLLRDIEADEIFGVITWMEDRTHRQVLELAEFINLCREHDVAMVTPGLEYDLSDPDQVSMWFVKVRFAEAEVERLSLRLRRQRLQAAERGEPHDAARYRPFGWTGRGRNKVPLARALAEQDLIREAADRVLAREPLLRIVRDWQERGVPTSGGGPWRSTTLLGILLSPRIAGYRSHHGKLYPGTWPPIIEPEKWEALRAILEDPARRTNFSGGVYRYLLTGLIVCGRCGRRLSGQRVKRLAGKAIYRCLAVNGGCQGVGRIAEPVDELVTAALFEAVESPEFEEAVGALDEDDPTAELYESLARDQGLLDRLEDKIAQELISAETAKRNRAEIERRMDRARAKLAQLGHDRVKTHIPRNLRTVWPDLSLDRRRAILHAVIERIELHPQGRGGMFDPDTVKVLWKE